MLLELLPELSGRLSGYAMNVPVSNGSVVDLVCWHEKPVTPESVNEAVRARAAEPRWKDAYDLIRSGADIAAIRDDLAFGRALAERAPPAPTRLAA